MPLYKVASIPQNTPIEGGQTITGQALEVTAAALTEDDESFERFETNLPLAGFLVVDIKLVNRSNANLKSLRFALQDETGKKFSPLEAKKQLKEMMKVEGVRLYAITGREETLAQLQAITLPKKLTLAPQAQVRGVLFFQLKRDVASVQSLTLLVQGAEQPLTVNLLRRQ